MVHGVHVVADNTGTDDIHDHGEEKFSVAEGSWWEGFPSDGGAEINWYISHGGEGLEVLLKVGDESMW